MAKKKKSAKKAVTRKTSSTGSSKAAGASRKAGKSKAASKKEVAATTTASGAKATGRKKTAARSTSTTARKTKKKTTTRPKAAQQPAEAPPAPVEHQQGATAPAAPPATHTDATGPGNTGPGGNGQPLDPQTIAQMLADPDREPPTEDELRKVKTGLTKRDLEHFRQRLLEHRAELLGDVESLNDERNSRSGNISNLPLHMADVGSDNYEQEFTLGLLASERRLLAEIEDALYRMEQGYYGVCVETGVPIKRERLEAKPWAKYCIEVVREKERRGEL